MLQVNVVLSQPPFVRHPHKPKNTKIPAEAKCKKHTFSYTEIQVSKTPPLPAVSKHSEAKPRHPPAESKRSEAQPRHPPAVSKRSEANPQHPAASKRSEAKPRNTPAESKHNETDRKSQHQHSSHKR